MVNLKQALEIGILSALTSMSPISAQDAESTKVEGPYTIEATAKEIVEKYLNIKDNEERKAVLDKIDQNPKDRHLTKFEVQQYENPGVEIINIELNSDDEAIKPEKQIPPKENVKKPIKPLTKEPFSPLLLPPKKPHNLKIYSEKDTFNMLNIGLDTSFLAGSFDINFQGLVKQIKEDNKNSDLYTQLVEFGLGLEKRIGDKEQFSAKLLMKSQNSTTETNTATTTIDSNNYTTKTITDLKTTNDPSSNRTIAKFGYQKPLWSAELALIRERLKSLIHGNISIETKDDLEEIIYSGEFPIDIKNALESQGFQIDFKKNTPFGLVEILTSNEGISIDQSKEDLSYLLENILGGKLKFQKGDISVVYHEIWNQDQINQKRERNQKLNLNTNYVCSKFIALGAGKSIDGALGLGRIEDTFMGLGKATQDEGGNSFYNFNLFLTSGNLKGLEEDILNMFNNTSKTSLISYNKARLLNLEKLESQDYLDEVTRQLSPDNPVSLNVNAYEQLDKNSQKKLALDWYLQFFVDKGDTRYVGGYNQLDEVDLEERLIYFKLLNKKKGFDFGVEAGDMKVDGDRYGKVSVVFRYLFPTKETTPKIDFDEIPDYPVILQ